MISLVRHIEIYAGSFLNTKNRCCNYHSKIAYAKVRLRVKKKFLNYKLFDLPNSVQNRLNLQSIKA